MKSGGKSILWILALTATAATTGYCQVDLDVTASFWYGLAGQTNIVLQAADTVTFSGGSLSLPDLPAGSSGLLTVQAGNNIIINTGTGIIAGNNWSVNFTAGPQNLTARPAGQTDGVYFNGNSYLQTSNGNINVWSANDVLISDSATFGTADGSGIRTTAGGNINVTAEFGDVNTGGNTAGFVYQPTAPYYTTSPNVGGISTEAGGNVTISAGGDVTSYLPGGNLATDAGSGAFGSQPGNVTITAGGNVYGHFVLANGAGTVTAGQNAGGVTQPFALSLIDGTWGVYATNGYVYLQEVRNPNGLFNSASRSTSPGYHLFNYGPAAEVDLNATGVYLTDAALPRLAAADIQVLYPPILNINAGSNGIAAAGSVTLFPSANQSLNLTTTAGGYLEGTLTEAGTFSELLMSDSSQTRWINASTFGATDHGTNVPVQVGNTNPVVLNISGSMENLDLITTKATQITLGGDMINCGFSGQNLQAGDVSSITVAGQIYNASEYSFVDNVNIPAVPASDLFTGMSNSWDNIFALALNPAIMATLTPPTGTPASDLAAYAIENASLGFGLQTINGQLVGMNPGFVYDPATEALGYAGPMPSTVLSAFGPSGQPLTILHLVNGVPVLDASGLFVTDTVNWAPPSVVQALYTASQNALPAGSVLPGCRIGGPGQFNINAGSISLGNSYGILSCGVYDPAGGFGRYGNLAQLTPSGATLNVTLAGDLDMPTSAIAAIGGGDVNVTSTGGSMNIGLEGIRDLGRQVGFGIFTTGQGNVNVSAFGDIDIDGSSIATYNGGNIFVESLEGNVNVGSGGTNESEVGDSYVNPATEQAAFYQEYVFGGGINAFTLVNPVNVPNAASFPGNITVLTPQGNITFGQGGVLQEPLSGDFSPNSTITLTAGTPVSGGSPGFPGVIDMEGEGVIGGGTITLTAYGSISGLEILGPSSTNVAAVAGANIQFTVSVLGAAPIDFQWFKNGANLPGETNATLSLTDVNRSDAATYTVEVSNDTATVTNTDQLHVIVPEVMTAAFLQTSNLLSVSFSDVDGGMPTAQDIPTFVIQSSPDLLNWTSIDPDEVSITTNDTGGLMFQVPVSPDQISSFYRILSQ